MIYHFALILQCKYKLFPDMFLFQINRRAIFKEYGCFLIEHKQNPREPCKAIMKKKWNWFASSTFRSITSDFTIEIEDCQFPKKNQHASITPLSFIFSHRNCIDLCPPFSLHYFFYIGTFNKNVTPLITEPWIAEDVFGVFTGLAATAGASCCSIDVRVTKGINLIIQEKRCN